MYIGTLLEGHGTLWLVRKVLPSMNTAIIESQEGVLRSVGFEEAAEVGYQELCLPLLDWPSIALKSNPRGRLQEIRIASLQGERVLRRFADWVKLDEFQIGGALFLNPALHLGFRDRLILTHDSGRFPADIPKDFESLRVRQNRVPVVAVVPKGDPDLFDHLLEDDL